MKIIISALFIFQVFFASLQAQIPNDVNNATNTLAKKAQPGALLTQFAKAIKPASFLGAWSGQKSSWLSKAGKITDAIGVAQSISSLAGFIKPGMFKSGFNLDNLLNTANTVKTMADATGLLKNLEGGLKPEAFTAGWTNKRSSWLNALNLLK